MRVMRPVKLGAERIESRISYSRLAFKLGANPSKDLGMRRVGNKTPADWRYESRIAFHFE